MVVKNDSYYLDIISKQLDIAISCVKETSKSEFGNKTTLLHASMFSLIQISECFTKMNSSYIIKHANIDWDKINYFADLVLYDYDEADYRDIFDFISEDFPRFKASLSQ